MSFSGTGIGLKFVIKTNNFGFRYWAKHKTPPVAGRYANFYVHPIRPKILHMLAHRDPDTLWWHVSVNNLQSSKRVVRSWCARRVRLAFKEALKQQGLDMLGKRISESSPCPTNLTGNIEIFPELACVTQSSADIQKDANDIISQLVAHKSTEQ